MLKQFEIMTDEGAGEAIKPAQDAQWDVAVPYGDFRWFGSINEVKAEIRRRFPDATFPEKDQGASA